MAYSEEQLNRIYDRANGRCHVCRRRLAFTNYGSVGRPCAWEVDNSRPRARGGSDHGNNLYAAYIACNRSKQAVTSATARAREGFRRAPLSQKGRDARRASNTTTGAIVGGIAGALVLGPAGILLGGAAGGTFGNSRNPNE